MFRKILTWVARIIVGVVLLYTLLGFTVVPLVLSWVLKGQVAKILRHPVEVRRVQFNPYMLVLDIKGLKILDDNKELMAGFDDLLVDVSFWALCKKMYRIEKFQLDGLKVNVVLKPGNRVNLMDLAPEASGGPAGKVQTQKSEGVSAAASAGSFPSSALSSPLPVVVVDSLLLRQGEVRFVDETISPQFVTALKDIELQVAGLSTAPDCLVRVGIKGRVDDKGILSNETQVRPFQQPLELETTLALNGYAMNVLSPYVGKYTGRDLKDGRLEFRMDYRIAGNKLTAGHKVLIQRFEFGGRVPSKDALPLPFGLAVALLEDPQGRINISLPVSGDMSKPDFHYWHLVGQVARNFFMGLVTKPFAFLASALGADSGTDEMGYVRFLPGKSELASTEITKLKTLVKGMKDRPKLLLEVNGGYDPAEDWKAIKVEVLERDFKELRAQSTRSDSWVYQMLYQRRFGIRELWDVTKKFKLKEGEYNDDKLVDELKRQLIESGEADKAALEALGAARAKSIYDRLLADGMDAGHLRLGQPRPSQSSMGFVPSEFTLTVFGELLEAETAAK